jgi:hypothetical protein
MVTLLLSVSFFSVLTLLCLSFRACGVLSQRRIERERAEAMATYQPIDAPIKLALAAASKTSLNATSRQLTLFTGKISPMTEDTPKFEDLEFMGHDGIPMPTCKPATIRKLDDEGYPVDFTAHGAFGNVKDIQFTSQAKGNINLGPGLTKYWYKLHPLLSLPED